MRLLRRRLGILASFKGESMRIVVLRVGCVDLEVVRSIQAGLCEVFCGTVCEVFGQLMVMPRDAYNVVRRQFLSSSILSRIWKCVESCGG